MPDYVAEANDKLFVHADELCASCLSKDDCALIHALVSQEVATMDGIHILSCKDYMPDRESEYYVDTSELDALLSDIDEMQKNL